MLKVLIITSIFIFSKEINADYPKLHKRQLIIYANPTTIEGKLVKQHLQRDWLKYVSSRSNDKKLLSMINKYETRRKIIHKYFDVKIVETSDKLYFKIGKYGTKIYFPEVTEARHPNEYPGYVEFFFWVVDTHYYEYFKDYHYAMCDEIRSDWSANRSKLRKEFINKKEKAGYEYIGYEFHPDTYWEESFVKKDKNGVNEYFNMEQLGWKEPDPPTFPKPPNLRKCPVNKLWKLPF